MAIQFACPSCGQPIEIDEEWADSPVSCPYCQKVVTAPGESTVGAAPAEAAQAEAVSAEVAQTEVAQTEVVPAEAGQFQPAVVVQVGNRWGRRSLICGVAALVLFAVLFFVGAARLRPVIKELTESGASPAEAQKEAERVLYEEFQNSKLILVGSALLTLLALGGTIMAVIGLTRPGAKKGQALAGLIICGSFLMCQCAGMLLQMGRWV